MVVLKKVKASTLMETLIATVLVVVIFMIASMILNNLFFNTIKNDTRTIDAHMNEAQYLYLVKKINLPYYGDVGPWSLSIERKMQGNQPIILFEASNSETHKTITKSSFENRP